MSATLTPNITVGNAVAVSIAGTLAYAKSGSLTRNSKNLTVTNARSGGYQQMKAGSKGAQLSLELVYNGDSPPAVSEGMEVTVIFDSIGYETSEGLANGTTPPSGRLITGQFLISSIKDTWAADGDYGWTIDADSTGAYTAVETASGATPTT